MHTVNTNMTKMLMLRVHIAPVGFEVDRIIIPLKQTKADKLWLISHDNKSSDLSGPYLDKIKKACKSLDVKVEIAYADRLNLFKAIKSIRDIIAQEVNNHVYVNVASGSKIQAIACMMACMMLKDYDNLRPFYAEPEKYLALSGRQQSEGVKGMIELPTYEIQIPKQKLLKALKIIVRQKNQKITKKEMAEIADREGIINVNAEKANYSQARFASLDANIIAPLENEWKFIEVEKVGRNRWISITDEGKHAAEFLI